MARSTALTRLPRWRRLAWRGLTERPGRSALTAAGVALGVAFFVGVTVSNATVNQSAARYVNSMLGSTDVAIRSDSSLPPVLADTVAHLDDVASVSPIVRSNSSVSAIVTVTANSPLARNIRPLPGKTVRFPVVVDNYVPMEGQDLASAGGRHVLKLSAGRLPRPGELGVVLTKSLAEQLGAGPGATLHLVASSAIQKGQPYPVTRPVRVTGLLDDATYHATASVETVRAFDPNAMTNELDVRLQSGVDSAVWVTQHRAQLTAFRIENRATLTGPIRRQVDVINSGVTLLAVLALFVGGFLVYATFSTNIVERRAQVATLRATGASPRHVLGMVLAEAGALGTVGSFIGVAAGIAIAVGLARLSGSLAHVPVHGVAVSPFVVPVAIAVGIVTSMVGAAAPALRAARAPVVAGFSDLPEVTGLSRPATIGLVLAAVAAALLVVPSTPGRDALIMLVAFVGWVMAAPGLLRPLARVATVVVRRAAPRSGHIGLLHLVRQRSRSGVTVALLMLVLASGVAVNVAMAMVRHASDRQLAIQFGADMRLFGENLGPATLAQVTATPGVAAATPIGDSPTISVLARYPTEQSAIRTIDPATYFERAGFVFTAGSNASARAALSAGGAALLPTQLAVAHHLRVGQTIDLVTDRGAMPFRIAGLIESLTNPAMIVGARDGHFFDLTAPTEIDVWATPGTSRQALTSKLNSTVGTQIGFLPMEALRDDVHNFFDRLLRLYEAVLAAAVLIGALGLANTMVISVLSRVREIGMMRAVGADRRTVSATVITEAATLSVGAFVLALPLGVLLGDLVARGIGTKLGFNTNPAVPYSDFALLAIAAVVIGLAAAALPARRAATLDPVAAIRFD